MAVLFERHFVLIDVDDDQTVGGQWARTHRFRYRGLQLHIIGLFCGRQHQSLVTDISHRHTADRYQPRDDDQDDTTHTASKPPSITTD